MSQTKRGVCRICGCTERNPCPVSSKETTQGRLTLEAPCSWANKAKTLCTNPRCLKEAERRRTGFRGPSPDVGKATQFKPGNRMGSISRRQPLTERYKKVLEMKAPPELTKALGLMEGSTYADLVAMGMVRAGVRGKTEAAMEIANRVEGRVSQPVELSFTEGLADAIAAARKRASKQALTDKSPN